MDIPPLNVLGDKNYLLLSSIEQSIDILAVTGGVNYKAFKNLQVLTESLEFAVFRYNFGDDSYKAKIEVLEGKIKKLQNSCKDICSYKGETEINLNPCFKFDNNI